MSKNLDFSYEEHNRVLLEEMNNNAKFSAQYNLKRLSPYKIQSKQALFKALKGPNLIRKILRVFRCFRLRKGGGRLLP